MVGLLRHRQTKGPVSLGRTYTVAPPLDFTSSAQRKVHDECNGDFATTNPAKLHRDDTIALRIERLAAMYLRFVTTRIHKDSHKPQGVFAASYALLDSTDLTREEWGHLRGITIWFNANLPTPPKKFDSRRAIFWFKSVLSRTFAKSGSWSMCCGNTATTWRSTNVASWGISFGRMSFRLPRFLPSQTAGSPSSSG
jgi:hypothetical protein